MINEKTTIPLGWAATIIVTVLGLAFQTGMTWNRISSMESEISAYKQSQAILEQSDRESELKLQRLEIGLTTINEKLDKIDKKMDRQERR